MSLSRRSFLVLLAVAGSGGFAWYRYSVDHPWYADMTAIDSAKVIGQKYLSLYPGEANREKLEHQLLGNAELDDIAASARVMDMVREDFVHENIIRIDGWILSRNELRLCAIVALATAASW